MIDEIIDNLKGSVIYQRDISRNVSKINRLTKLRRSLAIYGDHDDRHRINDLSREINDLEDETINDLDTAIVRVISGKVLRKLLDE